MHPYATFNCWMGTPGGQWLACIDAKNELKIGKGTNKFSMLDHALKDCWLEDFVLLRRLHLQWVHRPLYEWMVSRPRVADKLLCRTSWTNWTIKWNLLHGKLFQSSRSQVANTWSSHKKVFAQWCLERWWLAVVVSHVPRGAWSGWSCLTGQLPGMCRLCTGSDVQRRSPSHCCLGLGWDAAGGWWEGGLGQHLAGERLVSVCDGARDALKFQETRRLSNHSCMGDLGWPPVGQGIGDRGFEPGWDGQEFVFGQFRCYFFCFYLPFRLAPRFAGSLTHNVDDRDSVTFLLSFRRTAYDFSRVVSKLFVANSSVPWLDHFTPPLTFFMTLDRTIKRLQTNKASDECGLVAELLHFAPDNTILWQLSWASWIKFCTQSKFHRVGQKLCSRRFQKHRTHEPRHTSGPLLISDSCTNICILGLGAHRGAVGTCSTWRTAWFQNETDDGGGLLIPSCLIARNNWLHNSRSKSRGWLWPVLSSCPINSPISVLCVNYESNFYFEHSIAYKR